MFYRPRPGSLVWVVGRQLTISTQNGRRLCAASAAALWIVAGIGYVILEAIAASGFRHHYSYAHNFISDLGVTRPGIFQGRTIDSPLAYLMNTAFYLQGTLFLVGAVLVVEAFQIHRAGLFLTLATTNAVGNILVATVHTGPLAQANGTTWLHDAGALLAIVGGNAAILAASPIIRNVNGPPWYRGVSAGLAVLGLLSFMMLVIESNIAARNIQLAGLWERCSVYTIIAWQMLTAACLLSRSRRPRQRQKNTQA